MSPEWEHLITVWGYWLMAFGALIEGETFLFNFKYSWTDLPINLRDTFTFEIIILRW